MAHRLLRGMVVAALLWTAGLAAAHGQSDPLAEVDSLNKQIVQLYRQGRIADAIPLAQRSLAMREQALGPDHPDVSISLNNLAMLYKSQNRYADAAPLLERSLAILEKALGPDSPNAVPSLINLAALYDAQGRYADAEPLYQRSLAIMEKTFGPDDPDIVLSLNNLATVQIRQGRYADAEPLLKRSLAILEKALGPDHPDVATGLNNLAALYDDAGRYADAEALYKRSLAIRETALGADHSDVATSLNNLATLYKNQGRYADAEPLYKRGLAIKEKLLGPDDLDVASSLSNLALLYKSMGRYGDAEPLLKRSLAIREKTLGADHPDVAAGLNNLATLYNEEGRYAEAEPLYRRSLAIKEKALGPDHPDVALALSNLAYLYRDQGRYADADPLDKRGLAIREKALGPDHPDVANSLNNLAASYAHQGRYADAEPLLQRSLAIREKALGPDHPDVALSLNNLASLYEDLKRYDDAEALYKRSLAIKEKALGPDHPDLATGLNNLGHLYRVEGRYGEAEPLYKRSLAIREAALGPDHPDVVLSLNNLAQLYYFGFGQDRYAEAVMMSRRAVSILETRFADGGAVSEQRSKKGFFTDHIGLLNAAADPARDTEGFRAAQMALASDTSRAVAGMAARFAAGSDALAAVVRERQDLSERWQRLDGALVKAASQPPDKRDVAAEAALRARLAETGNRLQAITERITREFPQYAELSRPAPLELGQAQALLAADEALIVYVATTRQTWLWVLRNDRAAMHRVEIGAKALAAEVTALRQRLDPDFNPNLEPFDAQRAYALHQKILAPATPLLDGARVVFVVPDGALEGLPIGVLVTEPPKSDPVTPGDHRSISWLVRKYAVTVLPSVGSLRALRQFTANTRASSPFVGIGNPVLEGKPGDARGVKLASLFRGGVADVDAVRKLMALPETADELRAVAKTMGATESELYLAERASEPTLRQARLEQFRVVEFATHGLMSGDLKGLAEPALVLTPPPAATPENDGLLTASKVATLRLNADWVVLSACNTAASDGSPDAGGLSGLAKAFFYAGARSLLVSHWSVPSVATVKLITGAFEALRKDPSIGRAEALRRSQLAMLDDASLPPEFAHPLAWAPFVLAGEGGAGR